MTPAQANIKRWREEPRGILQFAWEQFQFTPDPWQEEALLAFACRRANADYQSRWRAGIRFVDD